MTPPQTPVPPVHARLGSLLGFCFLTWVFVGCSPVTDHTPDRGDLPAEAPPTAEAEQVYRSYIDLRGAASNA